MPDKVRMGVAICIPVSGRPVPYQWAFALRGIDPPINVYAVTFAVEGKPVDEARNWLVEQAKLAGVKYMFFIDEDTVIPQNALRRFIFHMENNPFIDVVTGVYCSKSDPAAPLLFRGNGQGSFWDWKIGEMFWITGCGMGVTLIRMSVFEKIEKPYFLTIKADGFQDKVARSEAWTEDLYFLNKICDPADGPRQGYSRFNPNVHNVYCDGSILCEHYDVNSGKHYSLPWNSKPAIRRMAVGKKKILDLGCGEVSTIMKDGVPVRCDMRDDVNADYRCDIRQLPFASESYDVVFCMVEGSPILTKLGFKKIEDVVPGDEVWTHKSRWKPVTEVHTFPAQPEVFKIVTASNSMGIMVSAEHPILADYKPAPSSAELYRECCQSSGEFIRADELSRGHVTVTPLPTYTEKVKQIDLGTILTSSEEVEDYAEVMSVHGKSEWRTGSGDKTLSEQYSRTRTQIRGWIYHDKRPFGYYLSDDEIYYHSATYDIRLPRFVDVDEDLMRMIGYYLGDGSLSCVGPKHVGFHFNDSTKADLIYEVRRIVLEKFGISPTDVRQPEDSHGLSLRYVSKPFHDIVSGIIGKGGALDKQIPAWALWIAPELQKQLVYGLLRTDGSVKQRGRGRQISTVSWKLAEGVRLLLLRQGTCAGISKHEYEQKPEGDKFRGCGWLYLVLWTPNRLREKGGLIHDGTLVSRVWSVEKQQSDLPLYGLSVSEDESYYSSNIMNHNSSHTLEHFSRQDMPNVLDEWLRVLKPGGELRLVVPNLAVAAKQILEAGVLTNDGLNVLYGAQDDATNFHRVGFTKKSLTELVESKGLKVAWVEEQAPFSLLIQAIKSKTPSDFTGDGQGRRIRKSDLPDIQKALPAPGAPAPVSATSGITVTVSSPKVKSKNKKKR